MVRLCGDGVVRSINVWRYAVVHIHVCTCIPSVKGGGAVVCQCVLAGVCVLCVCECVCAWNKLTTTKREDKMATARKRKMVSA